MNRQPGRRARTDTVHDDVPHSVRMIIALYGRGVDRPAHRAGGNRYPEMLGGLAARQLRAAWLGSKIHYLNGDTK